MRLSILIICLLLACQAEAPEPQQVAPAPTQPTRVLTGAERLVEQGFAPLSGKRVGLIVNHTAMVGDTHLIDLVHAAPEVELVALFGPEHGLRGEADAGEKVDDGVDDRTGVPVYSLYGRTRKPTPAMLEGIEVLVFDIQDIGARFYTYISTMGLAMQAAAEQGIPFMVLDRPNPLGGTYVSGFMLEPAFTSFVGQFAIPVVHGMTVGELAQMVQGERLMDGLASLDLSVLEMEGWTRVTPWEATGLPWVPPSPNIPDVEIARIYPGACFFEGTTASEGRGTRTPFRLLGAPWANGEDLAASLNAVGLPGVAFAAASFTPVSIEGMSANPKLRDQSLAGISYRLTDANEFDPVAAGIHALHAFYHAAPERNTFLKKDWLGKLAGTDRLYDMLRQGATPSAIIAAWGDDVAAFRVQRKPYLLYE